MKPCARCGEQVGLLKPSREGTTPEWRESLKDVKKAEEMG